MSYKVLDLFCGCGGISDGFKQANYKIIGGLDKDSDAIETFNRNFINAEGKCCDLSLINESDIPNIFDDINIEEVDVIVGGPPCQGFSVANRYDNDEEDPRNKLFYEFIEFVRYIRPKAVLIENVTGILTKNDGYVKDKIYNIFKNDLGYKINSKILDSSQYGVPQRRKRAFFVATLNEKFDFDSLEKSKKTVTVKDAIGELYHIDKKHKNEKKYTHKLENKPDTPYRKYLRNEEDLVYNHRAKYPMKKVQKRMEFVPQGGNWRDIPAEMFPNNRKNRHSSAYKRLDEDDVSVTIDTGNAHSNYYHPLYNRIPSVREAARIQSFRDGFILTGSRTSQYRQVGNAVPPLLSKAIAKALKEHLKNNE